MTSRAEAMRPRRDWSCTGRGHVRGQVHDLGLAMPVLGQVPVLASSSALGLGLNQSYSVDREPIVRPDSSYDSSVLLVAMGHPKGSPLVGCLHLIMDRVEVNRDEVQS